MDYKNRIPGYRPPRPPKRKSRAGLWAGLAAAAVLAAVAAGWALLRHKEQAEAAPAAKAAEVTVPLPPEAAKGGEKNPAKADPAKPPKKTAEPEAKPAEAAAPPAKPAEPRFTFYKILPEQEAIVPESEIKTLKHEESLGKKPTVQYTLQAGSFANSQDADKLKAKLSALKIKSRVETVKIDNTAWSRVKIGPFNNMADADRVRTYLRQHQLDSVVQKAAPPAGQAAGR